MALHHSAALRVQCEQRKNSRKTRLRLFDQYCIFWDKCCTASAKHTPPTDKIPVPVRGEGALHDLSFAGARVDKLLIADIDCGMVDLLACIALEEQKVALFEIIDRIDPFPAVVV